MDINPYQTPTSSDLSSGEFDDIEWTYLWEERGENKGAQVRIEEYQLIIGVLGKGTIQEVERSRHFESFSLTGKLFLLKKPNRGALRPHVEVVEHLKEWRGPSTTEWLRHDLKTHRSFLLLIFLAINLCMLAFAVASCFMAPLYSHADY